MSVAHRHEDCLETRARVRYVVRHSRERFMIDRRGTDRERDAIGPTPSVALNGSPGPMERVSCSGSSRHLLRVGFAASEPDSILGFRSVAVNGGDAVPALPAPVDGDLERPPPCALKSISGKSSSYRVSAGAACPNTSRRGSRMV